MQITHTATHTITRSGGKVTITKRNPNARRLTLEDIVMGRGA